MTDEKVRIIEYKVLYKIINEKKSVAQAIKEVSEKRKRGKRK